MRLGLLPASSARIELLLSVTSRTVRGWRGAVWFSSDESDIVEPSLMRGGGLIILSSLASLPGFGNYQNC